MGAILRSVFTQAHFAQTHIGDTPITVAYRPAPCRPATVTDPADRPSVTLLYALLGGQVLSLNLFAPVDIAIWQDAANSAADEDDAGLAMARAEAIADRRRDYSLCNEQVGVDL